MSQELYIDEIRLIFPYFVTQQASLPQTARQASAAPIGIHNEMVAEVPYAEAVTVKTNLLLFSSGGTSTRPAFSPGGEPLAGAADPLPQALILTALVIGFAATAFLLALSWRAWREIGDDKVAGWRTSEPPADEELPDEAHAPQPGAEDGP